MECPVCDVTLSISAREGVEIDFCPQCRGVWLDRGELDKIIERAERSLDPAAPPGAALEDRRRYDEPRYDRRDDRRYDDRGYDDRGYDDRGHDDRRRRDDVYHRRKKKRSFLEDLFDFD